MTSKKSSIFTARNCGVVALGLSLALGACSPADDSVTEGTVEVPVVETVVVEVTPAPKYLSTLSCGGVGSAPGFERSYVLFVQDGILSFSKGDTGAAGSEFWYGTVEADGSITAEGSYIDTPGQEKSITFTGSLTETTLDLSGTRGPRECTVKGKLPNA